jgi:hypothetical protein
VCQKGHFHVRKRGVVVTMKDINIGALHFCNASRGDITKKVRGGNKGHAHSGSGRGDGITN